MSLASLLRISRDKVKLANGEVVQVKPLTVRQSYAIEQLFGPVAVSLAEKGLGSLEMQLEHADALINIVAVAIEKPADFVNKMLRDDFNEVFRRLLDIERNFFGARIAAASLAQKSKLLSSQQTGLESSKL